MLSTLDKELEILAQPTDESCGPTCLQAVYNFYDDEVDLNDIIKEVSEVSGGGTLGVMLGNHALKRGYQVTIYTYNLNVFDPAWFQGEEDLVEKLLQQRESKDSSKLLEASNAYLEFLSNGGIIKFRDLRIELLREYLDQGIPVLTGLSATYLYQSPRELWNNQPDDVSGYPVGHFVVLTDFDVASNSIGIADPLSPNPIEHKNQYYKIEKERVINSILLGIVTYDANLLIIHPKES